MSKSIPLRKLLALTAFLCSMLSAVMASGELNIIYLIVFIASTIVGLAMEYNYLSFPSRILTNLAASTLLVIILLQLRINYIIEPFMQIVLALTSVKMLENKTARDYMQLILLSLMMLVCYSLVSISIDFIFYCFGVGIICSLIMILSAWQTKDPNAEVSFENLTQISSRLFSMFLLMIPLCLIMFIAAPRLRSPFFGLIGAEGIPQVGFTDHVNLGSASEVKKNSKLAFRAEMDRQPLTPYWRGVVLDAFTGSMWIPLANNLRPTQIDSGVKNTVRQEMYLEPGRRRYLFALDVPISISKVNAEISRNGTIYYKGRDDGRRLQYSVVSAPLREMTFNPADLFGRRSNMELPRNYIPRLRSEVERITKGLDRAGKISAILDYLSPPNFEYSLTGMSNVTNALEHFIFVNKKGNCEFFASAMGVMLRMIGIPARLVSGYKGGMYNEAGGYYAVFEDSAHVWVEVWDGEIASWVRHDPTPHSPIDEWSMDDYGFIEAYLDLLDYQWTRFVLNYNLEIQRDIMESVKRIISNPKTYKFDGFFRSLPIVAGVMIFIVFGMYFLWKIVTEDKSKVLLRKFTIIMKRKGFSKHKSEGLREFSARLPSRERDKAMPFVLRFEEYYYKEKAFDKTTVKFLKEKLSELVRK